MHTAMKAYHPMPDKKPITPAEAYAWATQRCARSEQCRSEILEKLRQRGLPANEAEGLCDRLEDEGYIVEQRYADAFVHDKLLFDHWGRIKIAQALRLRGISSDEIASALEKNYDETAYREALTHLLEKKAASLPPEEDVYKRMEKLVRFAATRGYEPDLIFDVLK